MARTTVMGAGSWGTAFAIVLADAGNEVRLWGRRAELCQEINATRRNTEYLPDNELPDAITAYADPAEALDGSEVVVLAVPSQQLRVNLETWGESIPSDAVMVSLMKGVELGTHMRMTEVIAELTGAGPERLAVVSGPNLAREIANREPAASVVACEDAAVAERLQKLCHSGAFRPYTNTDVIGCELGGTTKNIIGLAVGVCIGLGFGDNTKASVITRGLAETSRLSLALGGEAQTMAGLAGLGDLVATCSSPLSRNHTAGRLLGQGLTLEEVGQKMTQTAEGIKSGQAVHELADKLGVDMPITAAVVAVLAGKLSVDQLGPVLLARELKPEGEH